jgi:hypothetical protein
MQIGKEEYEKIIRGAERGDLRILINLAAFRRFFCAVDSRALSKEVGLPLAVHTVLLKIFFYGQFLLWLVFAFPAWLAFGYWALLVTPAMWAVWFFYGGRASIGRQRIWPVVVFVGLVVCLGLFAIGDSLWLKVCIVLGTLPLLMARLLYYCTARLVFWALHRSQHFFEMFYLEPSEKVYDVVLRFGPYVWLDPPRHEQDTGAG